MWVNVKQAGATCRMSGMYQSVEAITYLSSCSHCYELQDCPQEPNKEKANTTYGRYERGRTGFSDCTQTGRCGRGSSTVGTPRGKCKHDVDLYIGVVRLEYGHSGSLAGRRASVSALYAAAAFGRVAMVELLLEKQADIDSMAGWSRGTPLIIALEHSFFQVADVLLKHGNPTNSHTRFQGLVVDKGARREELKFLEKRYDDPC